MTQSTPFLPDPYLRELADSTRPLNISLVNDFAFKKTFRNKKALKGLLSSLLDIPADVITGLEFPDTFLHGEYGEDHEGILDLKDADSLYSIIKFMDVKNRKVYCSKVSLRVLYLNQLGKATKEERETDVCRWARLISARDWEVLRKMAGTDEYMNAAVEEMEKINADKNLRYQYLMSEKAASDETTLREYYTQKGVEEGRREGQRRRTGRRRGAGEPADKNPA